MGSLPGTPGWAIFASYDWGAWGGEALLTPQLVIFMGLLIGVRYALTSRTCV